MTQLDVTADPYAAADIAAAALTEAVGTGHDAAIVLGSGWGESLASLGTVGLEILAAGLPGFAGSTVAGHKGTITSVTTGGGRKVLAFAGRVHLYEGHGPELVVHGIRTAVRAGCRTVVLTNAAGGLDPEYHVGDAVLISDHLNLQGESPMAGAAPPAELGARFVDLTDTYSDRLRTIARQLDPSLCEGIYCGLRGPHYETPAEVRMVRRLGADLVGMSTVLEAIAARHLGAEILGLSIVTNAAAGLGDEELDHQDVLVVAKASAARTLALVGDVLDRA